MILLCLLVLALLIAFLYSRHMMAYRAARYRANDGVMMRDMPGDTANHRAFEATRRLDRGCCRAERQNQYRDLPGVDHLLGPVSAPHR